MRLYDRKISFLNNGNSELCLLQIEFNRLKVLSLFWIQEWKNFLFCLKRKLNKLNFILHIRIKSDRIWWNLIQSILNWTSQMNTEYTNKAYIHCWVVPAAGKCEPLLFEWMDIGQSKLCVVYLFWDLFHGRNLAKWCLLFI